MCTRTTNAQPFLSPASFSSSLKAIEKAKGALLEAVFAVDDVLLQSVGVGGCEQARQPARARADTHTHTHTTGGGGAF